MDEAEDAKVGSETSSRTRSAENLPLNKTENIKIGRNGNGGDDKMVKKSPSSK